jgi:membrane associated rhomboid family serine protease
MIPIRDDNPTRRTAVLTIAIIALNFLAFVAWEPTFATGPVGEARQQTFFFCHAMIPWEVIHHTNLAQGGAAAREALAAAGFTEERGRPIPPEEFQSYLASHCPHKSWLASVFTAMFLHASWLHILGNMLFLWVFGNNVEDKLGWVGFPLFYFASGVAATVVQVAVVHSGANAIVPNLGASGAIAGVLGAYLLMFPRRRILTLVFFFFITFIYLPSFVVLGAWFVLQLFNGVGSLSSRVNAGGGVAVWAHIGGFGFGALMALLFFPKERFGSRPPPTRPDLGGRWRGVGWRRPRPPSQDWGGF